MTPLRKNFKGQLDDEKIVLVFRRHWIRILSSLVSIPLLLFLIFLSLHYLPVLMMGGVFFDSMLFVGLVTLHVLIHRQFLGVFRYYLQTVILTDRRIVLVDKTVFFRDHKESIDIHNIQDIQKVQSGLLQTVFNYGSLVFLLSGTTHSEIMTLVPRPEYQYKKINEVKLALQSKHMTNENAKMAG